MIETRQFNLNGIKLEAGHITPRTRQFFESRGAKIEEVGDKLKISGAFGVSRAETDAFLKRKENEDSRVVANKSEDADLDDFLKIVRNAGSQVISNNVQKNEIPSFDQRAPSGFLGLPKLGIFLLVLLDILLRSLFFAGLVLCIFGCVNAVAASVFAVSLMKAAFISSESALIFAMLSATFMAMYTVSYAWKFYHLGQYYKAQNAATSQGTFKQESSPALKVEKDVAPVRVIHQKTPEDLDNKVSPVQELGFFALPKSVSTTSAQCQALGVTDAVPTLVN